jgi:hypothetical protein
MAARRAAAPGQKRTSVTLAPPVTAAFGVDASFTQSDRHELGIHAVPGRLPSGPRIFPGQPDVTDVTGGAAM